MTTTKQKRILKNFLALSPDPDYTFTYDELLGFIFGLAMTPDIILPSEWIPIIFDGHTPACDSLEQMQESTNCLIEIYNAFTADFHEDKLLFPFTIEEMPPERIDSIYGWVSGFEEALALREELWDPEEYPRLSNKKRKELFYAMMVIQGLVDAHEVADFLDEIPDAVFKEAFQGMEGHDIDRNLQTQIFLMASLPLALQTLQNHARTVEKNRLKSKSNNTYKLPVRSTKTSLNEPCPCNNGQKYKKCCDSPADTGFSAQKKSNVIQGNFPRHGNKHGVPVSHSPAPIYQLKIGLQNAKPPIWRRVQVPGDTTLARLHDIIQIAMGWTDSHLHQFIIDKTCYCLPEEDDTWRTSRPKNEMNFTLQKLKNKIQPQFHYIYDFGDDWMHQVTVEKILPAEDGQSYPMMLTGRRSCPPEDIGGIHGYMHLLKALKNPDDEVFTEHIEWLDDDFDPALFGKAQITEINTLLKKL